MTTNEARGRLSMLCEAASDPALNDEALDYLLSQSARADVDGRAPSDDGWLPTYDLNAGAVIGWEMKAAKVAAKFDFQDETERYSLSQQHKQFLAQATLYRKRSLGSASVAGGWRLNTLLEPLQETQVP